MMDRMQDRWLRRAVSQLVYGLWRLLWLPYEWLVVPLLLWDARRHPSRDEAASWAQRCWKETHRRSRRQTRPRRFWLYPIMCGRLAIAYDPTFLEGYRMLAQAYLRARRPQAASKVCAAGLRQAKADLSLQRMLREAQRATAAPPARQAPLRWGGRTRLAPHRRTG
jgi:hypothetical protein